MPTVLKKNSMNVKSHILFFIIAMGLFVCLMLDHTRIQTTGYNLHNRRSHPVIVRAKGSHPCHNADFKPVHKKAVWTMLTDDPHYLISALKLGHSLRAHTTQPYFDMVVMELATKPLNSTAWGCLREVGWQRCVVDRIIPLDEAATRSYEPRFLDQFTKLNLWGMTMYETLVYLDSDTLTLRSIGHLLNHKLHDKSIAVAPQTWHGIFQGFNMGVFVIHPDMQEYERLLDIQQDSSIQFDSQWAEQGFLNVVYKDEWDDLGFINNALAWTSYQSPVYWLKQYKEINVIHYVGLKPWTCVPDMFETLIARPTDYVHVCQVWNETPCPCNSTL
jgi:hypothetical protein